MLAILATWAFLIAATTLETSGDAIVRLGLFQRSGPARVGVVLGAARCSSAMA
jgi:hypothetical protein